MSKGQTRPLWLTSEEHRVIAGWITDGLRPNRRIEWFEQDFENADPAHARALLEKLGVLRDVLDRAFEELPDPIAPSIAASLAASAQQVRSVAGRVEQFRRRLRGELTVRDTAPGDTGRQR
jgi:hypothetical protein